VADSLTPALALAPGAEELLPLLEELAELEKRNGGLRPENVRKVIDAVAPFIEERDPCARVYDLFPMLKDAAPARHREILVATLTDEERELCQKMSAGQRGSSSSPARPAVKSLTPALSRNGHESQARDPDTGRWRTSLFRRADTRPKLPGARFFTG